MDTTIAAISTSPGNGGIGIIRISGKEAFKVIEKIFIPKKAQNIEDIKSYSIKYGNIINPKTNEIIDEVLVSYFKEPKTYTKENMIEINCHGGTIVVKQILDIVFENGAIPAEPGEFTKRAFLNGRIDLAQAEAVIDIINSKTNKEAKASVSQLEGFLSKKILEIKANLLDLLSDIEANIDYPEYDIEEISSKKAMDRLGKVEKQLLKLEDSFESGKILKEGVKTVILGRPNAGKSSLLNALLKEDRAIVTDIEGTTRDTIEEYINIKGIPLKIIDTAGIRETNDLVEKIGVEKAIDIAKDADLIIAIIDISKELSQEDEKILNFIKDKNAIIVLNKLDLNSNILEDDVRIKNLNKKIIKISALNLDGIDELENEITNMFNLNQIEIGQDVIITNSRHKYLIENSIKNINLAKDTINNNMPIDIIAINVKEILESLGEITGDNVNEDLINTIFSKFCLGK